MSRPRYRRSLENTGKRNWRNQHRQILQYRKRIDNTAVDLLVSPSKRTTAEGWQAHSKHHSLNIKFSGHSQSLVAGHRCCRCLCVWLPVSRASSSTTMANGSGSDHWDQRGSSSGYSPSSGEMEGWLKKKSPKSSGKKVMDVWQRRCARPALAQTHNSSIRYLTRNVPAAGVSQVLCPLWW